MFIKLLKHETITTFNRYIVVALIPVLLTLLAVVFPGGENIFGVHLMLSISAIVLYLFISVIKSINNRLFDDGGYLTLTLPVKTSHILISKLVNALVLYMVFGASMFLVTLISVASVDSSLIASLGNIDMSKYSVILLLIQGASAFLLLLFCYIR